MAELSGLIRDWLANFRACEGYCDCLGHDDLAILEVEEALPQAEAANQLLKDALFLRQFGERPPGAPADPRGETWGDWDVRAERFLRSLIPGGLDARA